MPLPAGSPDAEHGGGGKLSSGDGSPMVAKLRRVVPLVAWLVVADLLRYGGRQSRRDERQGHQWAAEETIIVSVIIESDGPARLIIT